MSRFPALRRFTPALLPALLALSLGGCGQVGVLYLRMPDMAEPDLPPYDFDLPKHIFLPYGVTLPAPVGAVVPPASTHAVVPVATTLKAPVAATHPAPSASTHG